MVHNCVEWGVVLDKYFRNLSLVKSETMVYSKMMIGELWMTVVIVTESYYQQYCHLYVSEKNFGNILSSNFSNLFAEISICAM